MVVAQVGPPPITADTAGRDTDAGDARRPAPLESDAMLRDSAARSVGGVQGGGAASKGEVAAAFSAVAGDVVVASTLPTEDDWSLSVEDATSCGSRELGETSTELTGASTTETGEVVDLVDAAGVEDEDIVTDATSAVKEATAMVIGGLVALETEALDALLGTATGKDDGGSGCSAVAVAELGVSALIILSAQANGAADRTAADGATTPDRAAEEIGDTVEDTVGPSPLQAGDTSVAAEEGPRICRSLAAARLSAIIQLEARWCSRASLESFSVI